MRVLRAHLLGACILLMSPLLGCKTGYLARSAWYQAELLHSRVPLDEARTSMRLSEAQLQSLDLVGDAKAFGEQLGLSPTDNYDTIALEWGRTIWNVTACDRLSFEPHTWWFPIVGRVPYLGFFREQDAQHLVDRMRRKDLDVYARTAGAYSTLGWFRDPILVPMLEWGTFDLAETVLHELAHATVWIRGRVDFNESFASFVGEEAAFRYLEDRYGADSDILVRARADFEDVETWRRVLQQLYTDLDTVYTHEFLTSGEKQRRKAEIFSSLGQRVASAEFHHPERYLRASSTGQWNNARLVQFKTYNSNRGAFETLLAQEGGDLLSFMKRISEIAQGAADPFGAIESATQP